jgi:hypothetical protein
MSLIKIFNKQKINITTKNQKDEVKSQNYIKLLISKNSKRNLLMVTAQINF